MTPPTKHRGGKEEAEQMIIDLREAIGKLK